MKIFHDKTGKSFVHVNDLKSAISQKYRQAILLQKNPTRNLDINTDPYNQRNVNTLSTLKLKRPENLSISRNNSVFDRPYALPEQMPEQESFSTQIATTDESARTNNMAVHQEYINSNLAVRDVIKKSNMQRSLNNQNRTRSQKRIRKLV